MVAPVQPMPVRPWHLNDPTTGLFAGGGDPFGPQTPGTENNPGVSQATSQPGMMSALGTTLPYQLNTPTVPTNTGQTGPVPQPPMTGASDAGSPTGVAAPPGGSAPGFDWTSLLSTLFGSPNSSSALSGLGTYGALAGLGMYEASNAQKSNASTIAPLNAIGQPLVDTGQGLIKQSQGGQLTPAQQQVVNTSQSQGKSMVAAATPIGAIAQDLFKQYASGNLKPADQAQLDQQTTAAKQQVLQALGPNADSTMRATYFAQIDQQADITKQQILNGYLATGNTEFDQWATTTQAGQATILAGQQYAVTQLDNMFQKGLEAINLGGNSIMAGIQLAVQSNTEIANALQSFMGNLAKAYALQKAGSGGAGGTGAGGGSNPLSSAAQSVAKQYGKQLLTGGTDTAALDAGVMPGGGGLGALSDIFGTGAAGEGTVLAGGADLGSIGSAGAGGMFDFSSMLGGAGSSAAGGAAAATGTEAAGAGAGAAAAGGGGAAAGGESGAVLGAGAGAAVAGGLIAAPIIAGMRSSPVVLNSDYWNRFRDSLFKGTSGNANFDKYDSPAQQKALADKTLYDMIQQQALGEGGSLSGSWNIPSDIMAYAKSQGMLSPGYQPPSVSSNRVGGGRGGAPV